jgi:hypothetical protein
MPNTQEVLVPELTFNDQVNNRVFKAPEVTAQGMNSQVAEQANAKLRLIGSQTAYMGPDNFMKTVKYFLHRCNQRIEAKFEVEA